jgi:hypothetical protein
LKFAQQSGVPIIPVMMQPNFTVRRCGIIRQHVVLEDAKFPHPPIPFVLSRHPCSLYRIVCCSHLALPPKAKGWLGIITAGAIWVPMHDPTSVQDGVGKLMAQTRQLVPDLMAVDADNDRPSFETQVPVQWGDGEFTFEEMREELERLRLETAPVRKGGALLPDGTVLASLPAMVPQLPHGLLVSVEMQSVLDAVLSNTSPPQIGFCGMGGIGKTTVSSWVARDDGVRSRFGTLAWVTLGQTPVLESCINLIHLQMTGTELPGNLSPEQKDEYLRQAFVNRSVLLVLDDCWDPKIVKHFMWVDSTTNSKVLVSSRVRDVLDGMQIIDIAVYVSHRVNSG